MVGGPNASKHEIDYEFSQYERDGMIFEFADATDAMIKEAGGEKWIEQRDAKADKQDQGIKLEGEVKIATPPPVAEPVKKEDGKPAVKSPTKSPVTGEFGIKSFNSISDKMCRGIAKKTFTAAMRAGKDQTAILADVAQALSDAGKMTGDIQAILDSLSTPVTPVDSAEPEVEVQDGAKSQKEAVDPPQASELDIKDLNVIEDKMARGIAKKAFTAAKRAGEDKIEAVTKALQDAGKLDGAAETLLSSFTSVQVPSTSSGETDSPETQPVVDEAGSPEQSSD